MYARRRRVGLESLAMRTLHASIPADSSARHSGAGRLATLLAIGSVFLAGAVAAPQAVAAPLAEKQAQAAALDREVSKLEDDYAELQERYRGAKVDLSKVQLQMQRTQAKLAKSRVELRRSKTRLEDRALAVYRDGSGSGQLLEVARAGSFSEFFDKLDTIERVGDNDADILGRVRDLTERVAEQERQVRSARDRKAKLVRTIDKSSKRMNKVLGQKRSALGSVTAEIRTIMEAQRAAEAARLAAASRRRAATISAGGTPTDEDGDSAPAAVGGNSVEPAPTDGGTNDAGTGSSAAAGADESSSAISVPLPPPSGGASAAAGIAMGKVGSPYVYGASGPSSFDCSGLVVWAFAQAGRGGLPHSTYSLIGMGVSVPFDQAQVGDLVFTNNSGHMGIYVGGGSFVHAPRTGRTVAVESLGNYSIVAIRRI